VAHTSRQAAARVGAVTSLISPTGCRPHPAARLRQNDPTGKISLNPSGKSLLQIRPSHPARGAYRDRHETRDGMWWTRQQRARDGIAGRALWPVSDHRTRWRAVLKRTVKSCGPGASMVGVKSAEGKSARPGADEPAIRRRRRQTSPILRGDHDISRKAIAQGMSDCLRCPVCSCALSLALLHTRPRVQRASGIPCSLPFGGTTKRKPRAGSCRENADAYLLFE
jgi:hypothetical protein